MKNLLCSSCLFILIASVACSNTESTLTPITNVAVKCAQKTILDTLLSSKQLYYQVTWANNKDGVILNLKDKKGKVRTFFQTNLYEWDIEITQKSSTKVDLIAGSIKKISGNNIQADYSPDSFFFEDNNCKILTTTDDNLPPVAFSNFTFKDITESKDLATILGRFGW